MTNAHKLAERLIKKYPNRRLYDTQTSSYITLADVRQLVRNDESFAVVDARSGEDITRSILLQIVLEEEAGESPLLSRQTLSQMIRCYAQAVQGALGASIERSIQVALEPQAKPPVQGTEAGALRMPAQEQRQATGVFAGYGAGGQSEGPHLSQ